MGNSDFYTGRGDRGDTGRLRGKARIPKSGALVEALGTLDEATSAIGLARALSESVAVKETLVTVQHHLSRLAAHLSAVPEARREYPGLSPNEITWLEAAIADLQVDLPALKDFVLPGESLPGAAFHLARTVVRRAERRLVALIEQEPDIGESNLAYMNRLSSLMFVVALREDLESTGGLSRAPEETDT